MNSYIERFGVLIRQWAAQPAATRPDPLRVPPLLLEMDPDVYDAAVSVLRSLSPVLVPLAVRAAADNLRIREADREWFTQAAWALYAAATRKTP